MQEENGEGKKKEKKGERNYFFQYYTYFCIWVLIIDFYFLFLGLEDFKYLLGYYNGRRVFYERFRVLIFFIMFVLELF